MVKRQSSKLSIEHCKKVLKKNGVLLTDEQVEKVRDFLSTSWLKLSMSNSTRKEGTVKGSLVSENKIKNDHLPGTWFFQFCPHLLVTTV